MVWRKTRARNSEEISGSEALCGPFRVVIHRHCECGDRWFLFVYGGDMYELKAKTLEEAEKEAHEHMLKISRDIQDDLQEEVPKRKTG